MQVSHQPRIFVAGHRGMVGSAIVRALLAKGYTNVVTRTHSELDLTNQAAVRAFFQSERIDQVYLAAAKVGGIHANNTYPAEFIYQNLAIQSNVIHEARQSGVKKLLFLGSSCIYPRDCPQPIKEEYLLTGPLEPTNEPYAIAKIAGIKMCESYNRQYGTDFRSVMPCNLYGPGDNYNLENSHVLPAMIRKFHLAKLATQENIAGIVADEKRYGAIPADIKAMIGLYHNVPVTVDSKITRKDRVTLWGTGAPLREFMHVADMADACIIVMEQGLASQNSKQIPGQIHINISQGKDISIRDVANYVAKVVGYSGQIDFNPSMPDGAPRKLMDNSRLMEIGWQPKISLELGLHETYVSYTTQKNNGHKGSPIFIASNEN